MNHLSHAAVLRWNARRSTSWLLMGACAVLVSAVSLVLLEEQLPVLTLAPVIIFFIALFSEFVDSALGMGYGTILTPVLLMMGYEPLDVIPAILLSELLTGVAASVSHQLSGNVDMRPGTKAFRIAMVLGGCSLVGTIAAAAIAIRIPKDVLTLAIGAIIAGIGVVILLFSQKRLRFSWGKIGALGLVASFNKGLSGGGYGPLITGGEVLAGVDGKSAIAIASFAESLTCIVGVSVYLASGQNVSATLLLPLLLGALCSVPFSVVTVKIIKTKLLTVIIGALTLTLGILMLCRFG